MHRMTQMPVRCSFHCLTQTAVLGWKWHLVEVYVVVKWYDAAERSRSECCQRVSAHREEYEGHVQLGRLGGALGDADAIPHHLEDSPIPVLYELEYEEGNVGDPPQRQDPYPLPVLVDEVDGLVNPSLHWAPVTGWNHCLGEAG